MLEAVRKLPARRNIFSDGTSQSAKGLGLTKPGQRGESFSAFAALTARVPKPFRKEWSGGSGQSIHHKFVVVDFNLHRSPVAESESLIAVNAGGGIPLKVDKKAPLPARQ